MPAYGTIDTDYAMQMAGRQPDDDGPIYMLNLMAYRAEADYGADGEKGVSGREADDRYAPLDVLAEIGATVCFYGDVVSSTEPWDRVAVVRYPTRKSFIEMNSRKDFQRQHVHKEAGMDHTIVMGTLPLAALPSDADELVLLQVWSDEGDITTGSGAEFEVEGTIVGDGRTWRRARFSAIESADEALPVNGAQQVIVVRPQRARWT